MGKREMGWEGWSGGCCVSEGVREGMEGRYGGREGRRREVKTVPLKASYFYNLTPLKKKCNDYIYVQFPR